jgi:hypothetical protein
MSLQLPLRLLLPLLQLNLLPVRLMRRRSLQAYLQSLLL